MLAVDLIGIQVDPSTGASVLVLREHDAPNRLLPIIVGSAEATSIAIAASGQHLPRPLTHDVMATLVDSLGGHVEAVEVTELRHGSFLATLALSGPSGERRLDTRPSDAIALAIRTNAPLFASEDVLDVAGTVPIVELDEDEIDAEVADFRGFLAELDPDDFVADFPPPTGPVADSPPDVDESDGTTPDD